MPKLLSESREALSKMKLPKKKSLLEIRPRESVTTRDHSIAVYADRYGEREWILKDWIPAGLITAIVARPNVGKTPFLIGGLIKAVTTGSDWFDGTPGPKEPRNVLYCPTDQDAAQAFPIFKSMGIPYERVRLPLDDPDEILNLENRNHLALIEEKIIRYEIPLVVVDCLGGTHDQNENSTKSTRGIKNLANIAQRTRAGMGITHQARKSQKLLYTDVTIEDVRGNSALVTYMKSMIGVRRIDPSNQWRKIHIVRETTGICGDKIAGFTFVGGEIKFGIPPLRELRTKVDDAVDWLNTLIFSGEGYPSKAILQEGAAAGFGRSTLRAAALDRLGIVPTPVRDGKKIVSWEWRLP